MERTVELFGSEYRIQKCEHPKLGNGFEIDFTQMYEAPALNFGMMKQLSEMFGTDDIDFDDVSQRGCETCDYGSRYGYRIEVYRATKNNPLR